MSDSGTTEQNGEAPVADPSDDARKGVLECLDAVAQLDEAAMAQGDSGSIDDLRPYVADIYDALRWARAPIYQCWHEMGELTDNMAFNDRVPRLEAPAPVTAWLLARYFFAMANACFGNITEAMVLWSAWPETYRSFEGFGMYGTHSDVDGWTGLRHIFERFWPDGLDSYRDWVVAATPSITPASARAAVHCPTSPPCSAPDPLPTNERTLKRVLGNLNVAVDVSVELRGNLHRYLGLVAAGYDDGSLGEATYNELVPKLDDAEHRCRHDAEFCMDFGTYFRLVAERHLVSTEMSRIDVKLLTNAGDQQALRDRKLCEYAKLVDILGRTVRCFVELRLRVENALEGIGNREAAGSHEVTPEAAATDDESEGEGATEAGQPLLQVPAREPVGDQKPPVGDPWLLEPHESRPEEELVVGQKSPSTGARPSSELPGKGDSYSAKELAQAVASELTPLLQRGSSASAAGEQPGDDDAKETEEYDYILQRRGARWTVGDRKSTVELNHRKGFQDLAFLVQYPGHEFPVMAFEGLIALTLPDSQDDELTEYLGPDTASGRASKKKTSPDEYDSGAKKTYRAQIRELRRGRKAAKAAGDGDRVIDLGDQMSLLARSLLEMKEGNKVTRTPEEKRARVRISNRIERARTAIQDEHAALGKHLVDAVNLGYSVSYVPDPRPTWKL